MGRPDLMDEAAAGPIAWPTLDVEIPPTSPEAVAVPPMRRWLDLARGNRAVLDADSSDVAGTPLADLRRAARAQAAAAAAAYTRGLGLEVAEGRPDLLLCTGHQPTLVHPGIWIKYLALSRLVPPGGIGLSLIVDSDAADEIAAEVPRADGRLRRARVVLARGGREVPAEIISAPTAGDWRAFVAEVDAHLQTLPEAKVVAAWARARALPPPPRGAGLSGAVTWLRRTLEGRRPYLDLPVSQVAGLPAFRRFALAILRDARRFADLHNACLASYREHYGIRTGAQPFPDLVADAARVEVPFWYLADGRRWPLFVDPEGGVLVADGRPVGALPAAVDDAAFAALPIRPRALVLTAFARLVLSDLFIHGVGGGRYDRATDAIIRAFFGVRPPAYAVVTATLWLPFASGAPSVAERRRLQRLLLDLQHNPDRYLSRDAGPHRALVEEKWALIRTLDQPGLLRRERRAATRRIREINQILQVVVADRVAEVQEALRALDRRDQDAEVVGYRGFPFLLHPVESVEALVDALGR
ncbi:MAG: hypothetical protein QN187_01270 [Armatimonadota bacterium]|nr:hypothetical protein [Armatimonadota bacterium]MDR7518055.1 hypothetical protein [Armatimonadota bacterium]MDR7550474.1 hypothetical protein [Armatimonadota bacterium]